MKRGATDRSASRPSRRDVLTQSALGLSAAMVGGLPFIRAARSEAVTSQQEHGEHHMGYVTTQDDARIFYKDWGDPSGRPIVFSHGWPLTADDWDAQMFHLASLGFRCIAHDRRGHGRSTQTWTGNDMNTYADDLAAVVKHLDLKRAIHVGHSTGGGEVARYIGRHGTGRVAGAVLISAVTPFRLKTPDNPEGTPKEAFDFLRKSVLENRAQFYRDLTIPFYGYNREGAKESAGIRDFWWHQAMSGGLKNQYDCVTALSETDFRIDLKKFDVPTLILHGDDDQIVPIAASSMATAKLVPHATLKMYRGGPHGLMVALRDEVNADLARFAKSMSP